MPNVFVPDTVPVITGKMYIRIPYGKKGGVPQEYRIAIAGRVKIQGDETKEIQPHFYYAIYEYRREITCELFEYEFVGMEHR